MEETSRDGVDLPIRIIPCLKILQTQLQKWLPDESPAYVKHRGRQRCTSEFLVDLSECILHARGVRDVRADAYSLASVAVDFRDERVVVFGIPSEEHDVVGRGEFAGDGGAGPGPDASDDGKGFGCCCGSHIRGDGLENVVKAAGGFGGVRMEGHSMEVYVRICMCFCSRAMTPGRLVIVGLAWSSILVCRLLVLDITNRSKPTRAFGFYPSATAELIG